METNDMRNTIRKKNTLLITQTRRINLLEEKMTEWRKKYFQLKHADITIAPKTSALRQQLGFSQHGQAF